MRNTAESTGGSACSSELPWLSSMATDDEGVERAAPRRRLLGESEGDVPCDLLVAAPSTDPPAPSGVESSSGDCSAIAGLKGMSDEGTPPRRCLLAMDDEVEPAGRLLTEPTA